MYHRRFRRFNRRTVAATREMLSGWSALNETDRWARMRQWTATAADIYRMPLPLVSQIPSAGQGCYFGQTNQILMAYPSVVTLLHEFRHAMQMQGRAGNARSLQTYDDREDDARAWSLSLYHRVAPRALKRLVTEGRVLFLAPSDFAEVDTGA